jgi:Lon protease-like protein
MSQALPLFPLHVVLFPGMPLPLHIFEPRYREMIGRCLAQSQPFGVVLIQAGLEVGEAATPHQVGTRAEIVQHERLGDGRMNLVCVGRDRFRIVQLATDGPYLTAEVRSIDEQPVEPEAVGLAADLTDQVHSFAAAVGAPALELPADPTQLSFAVAGLAPIPLDQRQALLELTSTAERLRLLINSVDREARFRTHMGSTRPASPGMLGELSSN